MQTSSGTYPCDNGVAPGNPSCTKGWLLRTEMNDQTQAAVRGPALEYLVDIANESNSDLWINIQHGADATYMRRMAEMVRDRLNRHLRVYIEYSNETFNPDSITYPQRAWVDGNGISLNLDSNTYVAGQKFYGLRSLEMFRIFDEVFGEQRTRVVKVFVGWMVTPETTDAVLSYMAQSENNPSGVRPSAVSIAPYTGFFIAGAIIEAGTVASTTVSQILDMAEANVVREQINIGDNSTEESILAMSQAHQAVANRHNLSMVSYEGGQHIVQMNGNDNNVELGNKLIAANRHPRMYSIYHSLMDAWFNNGGGVFIAYTGALTPSVAWGSFGTVEYLGQDLSEAHKHRALLDYLAQLSSSQLTRNR